MLTGTPLQNNVDELFSLLNFLEPAQFPSQVAFLMEFGDLKTEAQVEKLKQVCSQFTVKLTSALQLILTVLCESWLGEIKFRVGIGQVNVLDMMFKP